MSEIGVAARRPLGLPGNLATVPPDLPDPSPPAGGPKQPDKAFLRPDVLAKVPQISRDSVAYAFALGVPLCDALAILGPAYVARHVHYVFLPEQSLTLVHALPLGILGTFLLLVSMNIGRFYDFNRLRSLRGSIPQVLWVWLICTGLLMALGYLLGMEEQFPRSMTLPWAATAGLFLVLVRIGAVAAIREAARRGAFRRRVAVVGATPNLQAVLETCAGTMDTEAYDIVGIFDDRLSRVAAEMNGIPVVGTVQDLITHCRQNLLDVIFITLPWVATERNAHIIQQLRQLPVDISLVPDMDTTLMPPRGILWLGGIPTLLINRRPLSATQLMAKWLEDKLIALAALICLSPIMLAAAVAVKLTSPGPILFRQDRFGFNGKPIQVLKFRSMYIDKGDPTGGKRTVRDDPRITPVGRILRRLSIDELPQLFNVLGGSMSIVGPRAHALTMTVSGRYYHEAVAEYQSRHRVKPGITGWAQVNGSRGEVETMDQAEERVSLDLYYVDNWSLLFDLKILILTVRAVFFDPMAY